MLYIYGIFFLHISKDNFETCMVSLIRVSLPLLFTVYHIYDHTLYDYQTCAWYLSIKFHIIKMWHKLMLWYLMGTNMPGTAISLSRTPKINLLIYYTKNKNYQESKCNKFYHKIWQRGKHFFFFFNKQVRFFFYVSFQPSLLLTVFFFLQFCK